MNEGDADAATTQRWWLNPSLARLAFGASTQGAQTPQSPTGSMTQRALLHKEFAGVDLDDPAQREFGDYDLIEQVGRGGMGVVYRARQRNLGREVAIKLLSAGQRASEELVDSLRREAQNAALLQHPNIVVVHEMGEHCGRIFFAMQLVRGRSLSQWLEADGPLPPRQAADLLRSVAEAVDYAHRLGVLHLDLKPGNILIDEHGVPLVADFGLARRLEQALDLANDRISGTPSYMAPEQAQVLGPALSPATDVWALGAVLYELLTGQPPFDAGDPSATVRLLLQGQVRKPSRHRPVPPDLEAICLHCLTKDPAQRYISARELADDLGRYLDGRAVSVRPLNAPQRVERWARREPRLAAAALVAFIVLLAGVITTSLQWRRAEGNANVAIGRLWESRREAAVRLQQDGKGFEALPRLLANIEEQDRAGRTDLAQLERRRIGMLLGQGAILIDRTVIADANPLAVELSPDGSLLAIACNDQSVRWFDTASLTERGRISLQGRVSSEGQPRTIMLLRFVDNRRLRVTLEWYSNIVSPDDGDTWLVDLDRRKVIEPPTAFADFADAIYSANGRYALLRNRQHGVQIWQVSPWRSLSPMAREGIKDWVPWLIGPNARFVVRLPLASRELLFYDPPDLTTPHSIRPPGEAGISAWMLSRDGRTLALGDFEGRVFLLDTSTRVLRQLPLPRGREVTWLAFSEDDTWLAAVSWDGNASAFDVASGDSLISGQMHQDFTPQRVGLSRTQRLLIVAGAGETALWRLPLPGARAEPAQRIGASPARHGLTGRYPIAWSLRAGLLASAGIDGQVRLWRLPVSPIPNAMTARQVPERTWFDGRHLLDVEWNQLRVISISGKALTRWLVLPQPPGFAELVDGARTLIVTTGPQLRVYDAASLRLRVAPVALPASPQHLLASKDGARLALTFGSHGANGFEEQLLVYDGRSGQRLPGAATLAGPVRTLALSADGQRLLAVGPAEASTTVFATAGLKRLGEYPNDAFQPVLWAAFARNGRDVLLVTHAPDPRLGTDSLLRWDPVTDRIDAQQSTGQARPLGVVDTAAGPFVAGQQQDLFNSGGAGMSVAERLAQSEAGVALATSADGRLVAHAFRREVQLYDATTGATLGPPLQSDSAALDRILQVAFASDGRHLLARTELGHWLVWPIAAEARPTADIAAALARLSISQENQQTVKVPAVAERAELRARDPGHWSSPETPPLPEVAARTHEDDLPIPSRAPGTSPLLLDLTRLYDIAPESSRNPFFSMRATMRPYPTGLQRIGGVDYDLRGMVQIGKVDPHTDQAANSRIDCLPVPAEPIAALHPLLLASIKTPSAEQRMLGAIRLHYRDGSSALLQIRSGREVPGYAGFDAAVPLVFSTPDAYTSLGLPNEALSGPRLPNPHPERLIRCLDMVASADDPVALFAITAEPATSAVSAPAWPVISGPVLRSHYQGTDTSRPQMRPAPSRRSP